MISRLDGTTRFSVIIGSPIAQVRSPEGITRVFQARGLNALVIPMEVASDDVGGLVGALAKVPNLDGIVVTVPHKPAAFGCCAETTERARFLRAVNVMRRRPTGDFAGDHVDGESLLAALRSTGVDPAGSHALLVGAGGAGSAIGLALLEAGTRSLAIADTDLARRDDLVARLSARFSGRCAGGTPDPHGFDLIVNATPAGMRQGDAPPLDISRLAGGITVADAVTPPGISALIAGARSAGCKTVTGQEMFDAGVGLLADFLLGVSR